MKHFNLERHQIYMRILDKYENNILPQIPFILLNYVLNNRDKLDIYLDRKVSINKILKHLNKLAKEKESFKLLDEIIKFVEGKEC